MAQMVRPTISEELHPMGSVPRTPEALSATGGEDRAQRAESVANLLFRGAGCRSPARPDLGELGEGNFSLLPDVRHEVAVIIVVRRIIGDTTRCPISGILRKCAGR